MHELAELDALVSGWTVPATLGVTATVPPIPLPPPSLPTISGGPSLGALAIVAALGLALGLLVARPPRRGAGRA